MISCSSGNYIRGKKELDAGDYQGAIVSLQEATAKNASRPEPWKYLGIAYYHDQKYAEAVDALRQATILAPDDGAAILYLGLSYERLGEDKQAAGIYQDYISQYPNGEFSHRIRHRVKYLTDQAVKEEVQKVIAGEKSIKTESIPDNTLAVLGFNPGNLIPRYAPLARGLSELLVIDLSKIPELNVVERQKLQAILNEINLTRSEYFDKERVPRVGKLLGAARVVSGQLSQEGDDQIKMEPGIIEIKQGFVDYPGDVEGKLDNFFKLQKDLAVNILTSLGYKLTPEEQANLLIKPTDSFLAFLSYSLGLEYADQGMYSLAEAQFDNALKEDPNFELAKKAREQVIGLSDYSGEVEPANVLEQQLFSYVMAGGAGATESGFGLRALQEILGFQPEAGEDEGDNPYTEPVVGTGRVTINGSFNEQ